MTSGGGFLGVKHDTVPHCRRSVAISNMHVDEQTP